MPAPTLPLRQLLPAVLETPLPDPTQQAFREQLRAVEALRQQLQAAQATQACAQRTYWQQVGPLAAATVAARRALYAPLEAALLDGYLNRAEMQQVTEQLLALAHDLQDRFGEDEREVLARYAQPTPPPTDEADAAPTALPEPAAPTHEQQAADAKARRQQRAAAQTEAQALPTSAKAVYRELARLHHPDRAAQADAATQQAQTALMQRITAAYAAGDLALLLTLLAEAPGTAVAADLLGRYTQALAQQRTQLAQALAALQAAPQPWAGTEKQQRTRLRDTKRSLRDELTYLDYLARQLCEPAGLRQWLKE